MVGSEENLIEVEDEELKLLNEMWKMKENEYIEGIDTAPEEAYLSGAYFSEIYTGDIDNDGINEIYAKKLEQLGLYLWRNNLLYRTNELFEYGKYEGKFGLQYYIIDNEEWMDFDLICGLNVWNKGFIPQMFWIEKDLNNILSASQEEVHLQYDMLYDYEGVERGYNKRIYIDVNLLSGDVRIRKA
ncbi:MAG: hypothetical protein HDQ96_05165 [Lachnospiraceae bacterium]|nr:hypothetical protein [Lachnospiraceae bacterium]